jgi:hypothetical protein
MAGLIARLTGRKAPKTPWDPALEGMGGYRQGVGPDGEGGFPGSTSATRYFKGASPREAELRTDTIGGFDQGFEGTDVRQHAKKSGELNNDPRTTPEVTTPRPRTVGFLRRNPGEWFGGVPMRSDAVAPATHAAGSGLNPLTGAAAAGGHSTYDTETPRTERQPDISGHVPGSANVRNSIALRYLAASADSHTYKSAPRPDQNGNVEGELGSGGGRWAYTTEVTVPNRYRWAGPQGGVQTWTANRMMPYTGRGDGARGAQLSGARYYASGPPIALNAGLGDYGVARLRGDKTKRPVSFTEPAPWTSQFYDTTESVGTADAPGTNSAMPDAIYVSPEVPRNLNSTGR